jgi:hypothetical protein
MEGDSQQLLQLEEKDVISSTATIMHDLCGLQEWLPMDKLHGVVIFSFVPSNFRIKTVCMHHIF